MSQETSLALLMRRERTRQRLTLAAVGTVAQVDRTLIWQLERGRSRNPTILVLHGISVALDLAFHDVCDAALYDAQAPVGQPRSSTTES